jgi:hypothetical protein
VRYKLILGFNWIAAASLGVQLDPTPEKLSRRHNIRVPEAGIPVWGSAHLENNHISALFGPHVTWQLVRQAERKGSVLPEQEHLTH